LASHPQLLVPDAELERLLAAGLDGLRLNLPLRTRSKILKSRVCEVLGYPVPASFKRTRPRFPGQDFDVYVQKSLNLQIWNQEIVGTRRYVLVRLDEQDVVTAVRVVRGSDLAAFDKTGTLTIKYQAKSIHPVTSSVLVSPEDTEHLRRLMETPSCSHLFPIDTLFQQLVTLVGRSFRNPGLDQERGRGALLHAMVEEAIGEEQFTDTGQFPDVPSQMLELKLQTSPTIDLGLVSPDSSSPVGGRCEAFHRDVRYAVFYASVDRDAVSLRHVVVTTGAQFFSFFRRFEGQVVNRKIQIPIPAKLFR
jgi:hypothetical protein